MSDQKLILSLKSTVFPIILRNAQGTNENYELRELTAAARDAYMDSVKNRMKIVNGKETFETFVGLHSDLLARCLFKEGGTKPVTADEIQQFPASTTDTLYKEARKLNHLDAVKEEGAPKND